jgi:hypothetical protein
LFRRYVELIPAETRRVVGAFASWQRVVLSMIRDVPEFERFLVAELRGRVPGFVAGPVRQ